MEIHATGQGAKNALTAWAKPRNHELLNHTEADGLLRFRIKKG